jgi:hypothetical protein
VIETTGDSYNEGSYARALMVSYPKVGKTTFTVASLLGALPWQTKGGVVDAPSHLHVIAADSNTLTGVRGFLKDKCHVKDSALKFRVYEFERACRDVSLLESDWDFGLYNQLVSTLQRIHKYVDSEGGVHALVISSVTVMAEALMRSLAGPPRENAKGSGMDGAKWQTFSSQLVDIRNMAQRDTHHCLWEAHIRKGKDAFMGKGEPQKDSIQIAGQQREGFLINVAQIFMIHREKDNHYEKSEIDVTYLNTSLAASFLVGGRSFNQKLNPKERDMAKAFKKLGLTVGGYNPK